MIKNLVKRTLVPAILAICTATSVQVNAHAFTAEDAIAAPDTTVEVNLHKYKN